MKIGVNSLMPTMKNNRQLFIALVATSVAALPAVGQVPDQLKFTIPNPAPGNGFGGKLTLSFPTVTGRNYTLWHSDTLTSGTWTNAGLSALTGSGATLTFTVPATTPGRRFFRVQADP